MDKIKRQEIEEKIKIFEAIKILNDTNPVIIREEINQNININLTDNNIRNLTKKINIFKSVVLLLTKDYFIKQIAEELSLSTSCIQRYLNDPLIEELGEDIKLEVEEKLEKNSFKGKMLGSKNYVLNNKAIKDERGKFRGSEKRI